MTSIGGTLILRDGDKWDYPWRQAVKSILPVCSEVVICDGGSTDGTLEAVREWMKQEPKLRLVEWPCPPPSADWLMDWWNYAREHLTTPWHFFITADECLHEDSYDEVLRFVERHPGRSALCHTRNFWFNPQRLIPHGHCCGYLGYRLTPQHMWMPADHPHAKSVATEAVGVTTDIEVYHYNWMRKESAYLEKEKNLQRLWSGVSDPRLEGVELSDWKRLDFFSDPLISFTKPHPRVMWDWLKERGHEP